MPTFWFWARGVSAWSALSWEALRTARVESFANPGAGRALICCGTRVWAQLPPAAEASRDVDNGISVAQRADPRV